MLVSIESGLIFSLITTESKRLYQYLVTKFDLTKLVEEDQKKIQEREKIKRNHNREIDEIAVEQNGNGNGNSESSADGESKLAETEFNATTKILENLDINGESVTDTVTEIDAVENSDGSISISSRSSHYDNFQNYIKTIPYNDKLLKLTYIKKDLFGEMIKWVRHVDNIFRVLMPIIFLSYIGSLLAVENT